MYRNSLKTKLFFLIILILWHTDSFAQTNIDRGIESYQNADFAKAKQIFEGTAKTGSKKNCQISYAYLALIASANGDIHQADSYFSKILELDTSFDLTEIEASIPPDMETRFLEAKEKFINLRVPPPIHSQQTERLEEMIKNQKSQIEKLESRIKELGDTIKKFKSENREFSTVRTLESQINKLTEENRNLKIQLETSEKEKRNLEKPLILPNEEERLTDEIIELKTNYNNLLQEKMGSNDEIAKIRSRLITKLNELKSYYERSSPNDRQRIENLEREIFILGKPLLQKKGIL